ncbi:MAG TPA: SRPBCC domain-containing protein [Actinomycetota bacterium]
MPTDLRISHSITIEASARDVWHALTTPDVIQRWFLGVRTETDWQEGSPIVHTGEWQGKPYEDKGTIMRVEPGRLLVHTHWSALSGLPDEPGNHQEVTWELSERDGATELTVTEVNLPSEQAVAVSEATWKTVLEDLKRVVEA